MTSPAKTPPKISQAGSGLQVLGVAIAVVGILFAAVGYDEIGGAGDAVRMQYLGTTALPALVGGAILYGIGAIIHEIRNRP